MKHVFIGGAWTLAFVVFVYGVINLAADVASVSRATTSKCPPARIQVQSSAPGARGVPLALRYEHEGESK